MIETRTAKAIMILEDDDDLAEGISLSLKSSELNFTICKTISEAKAAVSRQAFDLLILDINLPDGSGLNFCRQIRQTSQIPIALLTAKDMELDIVFKNTGSLFKRDGVVEKINPFKQTGMAKDLGINILDGKKLF